MGAARTPEGAEPRTELADCERRRDLAADAPLEDLSISALIERVAFDPNYRRPGQPDAIGELLGRLAADLDDAAGHALNEAAAGAFAIEWAPTFQRLHRVVEVVEELRRREIVERAVAQAGRRS